LVNTALDTLSQVLNIECCWIQTIRDRKKQLLSLAGERGFSDKMRAEVSSMGLTHDFCGQIIGMGNKIVIPDLNNNDAYGLSSFRAAGYKWLIAVPIMTYRAWGLLGTASKNKKIYEKDTAELIMVIAGLIANAWSKAHLTGSFNRRDKLPQVMMLQPDKITPLSDTTTKAPPAVSSPALPPDTPKDEEPLVVTK
jgi:signal transduction protein with GAF and PtsI domain